MFHWKEDRVGGGGCLDLESGRVSPVKPGMFRS